MRTRVLPSEEWDRLAPTESGPIRHCLDPKTTQALVVEDDGEIVGCWLLMTVRHAECVWVHPEHRGKTSVARRLWVGMRRLAREAGVSRVVTSADSADVKRLLEGRATPLPGEHFVIDWESESCPS